jgi:hypothetical protein
MVTFEEAQEALDQLINDLPPEIFRGLNCGVALRPDTLYDANGLLILGRYHVEPLGLGRYVTINYGSLMQSYGHLTPPAFIKKLRYVLHHELTHHLEHLAGDRSLEIEDEKNVRKLLRRYYRVPKNTVHS